MTQNKSKSNRYMIDYCSVGIKKHPENSGCFKNNIMKKHLVVPHIFFVLTNLALDFLRFKQLS